MQVSRRTVKATSPRLETSISLLIDEKDVITVSKVFSPEQVAMIESLVSKGNVMTYNSFVASANAQRNMPSSSSGTICISKNPSPSLPISPAPPMQQ